MPDPVPLEPGDLLVGKYRIERVLGKGGMGVVVLATHVDLQDRFAIKVLTGELDTDAQQRFLREARAAAQIKSEHVARVIDVSTLPSGVPYMVMEFLEGTDLAGLLEAKTKLAPDEAIEIALQACTGLTEAHARNFVHRDIKPANLFVTSTSDGRRVVKLLDFGISKASQDVGLTSTRAVLGTPAYMAPEQWRSAKDADERSDIWSLGCVIYELLSGNRPFAGENVTEMCAAVLAEDPPKLELGNSPLEKVVMRCLEKEPGDRYQRVPELARDLAACATDREAANTIVDRMDRVAGRSSSPSIARPATAPTVKNLETAPAPAVPPAVATTTTKVPQRTAAIAIAVTAVVAGGATFALTRSSEDNKSPGPTMLPQSGGTLRVAISRPDESDIALYAGQPTRTQAALRMVMERLLVLDDAGQIQPSVLARAESPDRGQTVVLQLRPNVKFHGNECQPEADATAADLEFSITEAIAHNHLDLDIASMKPNGLELTIQMKTPSVHFAHALSHVWLVPAKLADCEKDRTKLAHPIGSGPFRWEPSLLANKLTLVRWQHYWRTSAKGAQLPYLDRVELVQVPEASVALAAMKGDPSSSQALHVFIPDVKQRSLVMDPKTRKLIGEATAGLELGTRTNEGNVGLFLFEITRNSKLDRPRLRHAIALAIDRAEVVRVAHQSAPAPAAAYGRFLQPAVLGYDAATPAFATDMTRARRLLEGTRDLPKLVIGYSHDEESAKKVAESLTSLGLTVERRKIEMRDQSGVLAHGNGFDAVLISRWGKMLGDELISIGAYDPLRTTPVRQLLAELGSKTSRSDRKAIYQQIEQTLLDELPSIPLATLDPKRLTFAAIVRPEVQGFHDRASGYVPHDDSMTFAEAWLRRAE